MLDAVYNFPARIGGRGRNWLVSSIHTKVHMLLPSLFLLVLSRVLVPYSVGLPYHLLRYLGMSERRVHAEEVRKTFLVKRGPRLIFSGGPHVRRPVLCCDVRREPPGVLPLPLPTGVDGTHDGY